MDSLPVSNNYTFDRLHRDFELPSNPKQQKQIKFEVFTEERKGLSLNRDGQSLKVRYGKLRCKLSLRHAQSPSFTLVSRVRHATLSLKVSRINTYTVARKPDRKRCR